MTMLALKDYRERKGYSQEALAKMLGVTKSAISRWESGDRSPRISEINALAKKMGIEPAELLGLKPGKNGG